MGTLKKGFHAFLGYADGRKGSVDMPSIASLPYHFMGLPPDQVDATDKLHKEMRDFREAKERMRTKEIEEYSSEVRMAFKFRAAEDMAMGKLQPLEELLPSEKLKAKMEGAKEVLPKAKALSDVVISRQQVTTLAPSAESEIDELF